MSDFVISEKYEIITGKITDVLTKIRMDRGRIAGDMLIVETVWSSSRLLRYPTRYDNIYVAVEDYICGMAG